MFHKLDSNNVGYITYEEMKAGMKNILDPWQYKNCDWFSYFSAMDLNRTGKINFSEFTTAAFSRARMLTSKNINAVFDVDGDGVVSVDDLRKVFHNNLDINNYKDSGLESESMQR
jgi:Ca2+-binding EF-hand superfamily protein